MLQEKRLTENGGSLGDVAGTVRHAQRAKLGAERPGSADGSEKATANATPGAFGDSRLGQHLLVEFYACENLPRSAPQLQKHMVRAAELAGATVVNSTFHEFSPHGLSGVVILAESHLAVHTWPEYDCACVDLFSCSPSIAPEPGLEYLREAFGAARVDTVVALRGLDASRLSAHQGQTP